MEVCSTRHERKCDRQSRLEALARRDAGAMQDIAVEQRESTRFHSDRVHRLREGIPTPPKQGASPLRSLGKLPTDYGLLCACLLLLGLPTVFLTVYTVLAAATAGLLALSLVKWFHEMKAVDAGGSR